MIEVPFDFSRLLQQQLQCSTRPTLQQRTTSLPVLCPSGMASNA